MKKSAQNSRNFKKAESGLEASKLKRVKELEQQLSEYKTMVTELTHDNRAPKNLIKKELKCLPAKEVQSITWLAKRHYPLLELELTWG
jgi:putative transposase